MKICIPALYIDILTLCIWILVYKFIQTSIIIMYLVVFKSTTKYRFVNGTVIMSWGFDAIQSH